MRTYLLVCLGGILLVLGSACTASQTPAQPPAEQPEFRTTATVKDIMDSMIDPSADVVWDSVATIISAKGTEERAPRNDEEWTNVRRHTITLIEGSNMLLVPGRHIAKPGEKAEDAAVELQPEEIEKLVNEDRPSWTMLTHGLQDAAMVALNAVEAKDVEALLNSGEGIDQACESCHLKYWYPPKEASQQ